MQANFDNNLSQWLNHIERNHPLGIDMGLERVRQVAQRLHIDSFSIPVVTVAGTNGKGSTVYALTRLLRQAGLEIGSYISPHLIDVEERIQVNGQPITASELCSAFFEIERARETMTLTYFEFMTLAAFYIFKKMHRLDVIILEVGLGGRLDAVNVIDPDLAIITAIGYDHQNYLGHRLEDIAQEKAGILRQRIPVILSHQTNISTLNHQLEQNQNLVFRENEQFSYDAEHAKWRMNDQSLIIPQHYLPENSVSLAMAAYTILCGRLLDLPPLNTVISVLTQQNMPGRFQTEMVAGKKIIFDVAHNPLGSVWLHQRVKAQQHTGRLFAVWASLDDKDRAGIIVPWQQRVDIWFCGRLVHERFSPNPNWMDCLGSVKGSVNTYETISDAFYAALSQAEASDLILVFGSFYTVATVLACVRKINSNHVVSG